jgi:PAS domain-containing protein
LFLNNERTIERKLEEAFLALWLETRLTKNEIFKLYPDRAYMGGGAFGADAAAQFYFGKAADMTMMMNKVVEEGTAKRAMLDDIKTAGKAGTTNSYRDAWFVGYTGNFVCGVWYGNDDHSPLNRMTGGSLPAQTWHDSMTYAHQGIDLKQIAGVGRNPATVGRIIERDGKGHAPIRPAMLTQKGVETLLRVKQLMDEAGGQMGPRRPQWKNSPLLGRRGPLIRFILMADLIRLSHDQGNFVAVDRLNTSPCLAVHCTRLAAGCEGGPPPTPAVRRGLSAGQEWPPRVGPVVDEVLAHGGRAGSAARSRAARRLLIRLKRSLRVKRASTFENVAVGIAHVDRHLGMLRVNQAFCRIFGYSVVKTALPSLRTLASLARRHRVEEGRWHVSIRPLPRLDQGPQSRQHHVSAGARCRVVLEDSSCSDLIGPVAPQHVVCPCVWGAERRTRGGLLGFALGPVRPC